MSTTTDHDKKDGRHLLPQLRSERGRAAALTALRHLPLGSLAEEVNTVLLELLAREDAADERSTVIDVILGHPSESLREVYVQLAYHEPAWRRAQVLEHLQAWMGRIDLTAEARGMLADAAASDLPWLRFVAAVQSVWLGLDDGTAWQRAVEAIVASRIPDPMRCIRPQAEEILGPDERTLVDRMLRARGELPL